MPLKKKANPIGNINFAPCCLDTDYASILNASHARNLFFMINDYWILGYLIKKENRILTGLLSRSSNSWIYSREAGLVKDVQKVISAYNFVC